MHLTGSRDAASGARSRGNRTIPETPSSRRRRITPPMTRCAASAPGHTSTFTTSAICGTTRFPLMARWTAWPLSQTSAASGVPSLSCTICAWIRWRCVISPARQSTARRGRTCESAYVRGWIARVTRFWRESYPFRGFSRATIHRGPRFPRRRLRSSPSPSALSSPALPRRLEPGWCSVTAP